MKNIVLVSAVILLTISIGAQNLGEIQGKVLSKTDNQPVIFTPVTLSNAAITKSLTTDENGKYKFNALEPGQYKIKVSSVEYGNLSVSNIVVTTDNITFVKDIYLESNQLIEVDIIWHRELIKKDNPALISIRTADIKQSANSKSPMGMISQLPGISSGNDGQELYFRGSRPQSISTYIDGVKLISNNLSGLPSNAIKSINVYTGGVPAAYGDVTGGVIILETKSYMDFYTEENY